jgi:hypothetical protein
MTEPIEIKFPFPVKTRDGETIQITGYTPGLKQPWKAVHRDYCLSGHFSESMYESEMDIVSGLPDMRVSVKIQPVEILHNVFTARAHRFVIGWTAVGHITMLCLLSLTLHVITDLRIVYWWHDLIWPTPWIEKKGEK